jgi:hypothetical protein
MRLARLKALSGDVRKQFFFEKKNQKTFAILVRALGQRAH